MLRTMREEIIHSVQITVARCNYSKSIALKYDDPLSKLRAQPPRLSLGKT
jgi:hypothetical protein